MPIELYPSVAKIKRNGVYENLPGFVPETGSVATQQMIATGESINVAQYVHNKGEYFRLNDTLYQAIVKINVGDAIVVGTNCEVAVLGNDVTHIANSIAEYELGIATAQHTTGEYFMVGETLYVATADIDIGDSISTSTNCRLAVVCDELSEVQKAINNFTNKSVVNIEPTLIDAYTNAGKLNYPNSNGKSIYFPIENGNSYNIHITGTFNRFGVFGCNEIASQATVTTLYSEGAGTYTDKTYYHVADNTYKYLLIMLAYSYPQYNATYTVVETKGYQETSFLVNGIAVVEQEKMPSELLNVTDGQNISNANYENSTLMISNSAISAAYEGKSIFIELNNGITYDITISGIFNRWTIALCQSKVIGSSVNTITVEWTPTEQQVKTAHYTSDGTYNYLMIVYNYDDSSQAQNIQITAKQTYVIPDNFTVNGVPVYTKNEMNGAFTSGKYARLNDEVTLVTTASEVFALYDALVTNYPQYIAKNTLTVDNFTNYEYVIGTSNYNISGQRSRDTEIAKPVILLTSGVHGYERSAVMSTYYFIKAMCENKYPACEVLQKCTIRLIPCVCPWGFTNDKRYNENGVNINRNFDAGWTLSGEPFTNDYSGASAASELETQLVQDWIDTYLPTALMLIDHHNSGFNLEISYLGGPNTQTNISELKSAYRVGVDDAIGYWTKIRGITDTSTIYGYTGTMDIGGSCAKYGTSKSKLSVTLETSWDVNSLGKHSNITIGRGAESLSIVLIGAVDNLLS